MIADKLNLSNQENIYTVLSRDHKPRHYHTSTSYYTPGHTTHWGTASHTGNHGNHEGIHRSRLEDYKFHEHRSRTGYSSRQTNLEDTLAEKNVL